MIPNGEGSHYLAVIKPSTLLRGITSKHHCDFYCLNCSHSFATKNKLRSHKKVCTNKDFCNIIMPSDDIETLEFNQYQKFDKALFHIYAYLECLIEKIDRSKNNPENSSTTKLGGHILSRFLMSIAPSFKSIILIQNFHILKYGLQMKILSC